MSWGKVLYIWLRMGMGTLISAMAKIAQREWFIRSSVHCIYTLVRFCLEAKLRAAAAPRMPSPEAV